MSAGSQFFYLQDVGPAEAQYRSIGSPSGDVAAYFHTNDEPALNRQLGLELTSIESNDTPP